MPFRAAGKYIVTLLLLLVLSVACSARAQKAVYGNGGPGPIKADHLTVELVSAGPDIAAGGTQTLGFVFTLEDKWHIYWKNAGFAGFPPSVDWSLPKGITADDLQFPQPTRLPFQGAVDYGYEDNVTYPFVVHAAPNAKPGKDGTIHLSGHLKWLVCREQCVPGTADLGIDLHLVPAGTAVAQQGTQVGPIANALKHIPEQPRQGFSAHAVSDGKHIALTFLTGTHETDAEFYPLDEQLLQDNADQPIDSLPDGARIYLTLLPNTPAPKQIHGVVELNEDESYQITADVAPGAVAMPAATDSAAHPQGASASSGAGEVTALTAMALAFAGGIILNLMPCVFPVLFLKALSLVQSSGEDRQRSRAHGLVYTAGIVASFWAIVAVLLALRSGGARFGWGFQLQSPGFVGVLALLLFFFALSLSGVFELGLSLTSAGDSLTRKQGYAGSFFTGVLATVVATPCVGPFMGVAIGYALSQPAIVTLLVFTALALGLALPYLALTFFPSLMRWLPKPGAWMETLKQITAIPLYFTVIWLVYLYGRLFGSGDPFSSVDQAAMLLVALLVLSIGAWILGRWPRSRAATITAVLFLAGAVALPFALRPTPQELAQHGQAAMQIGGGASSKWQPFTPAALDQARAGGKSVFVDFTAAWCLSCQVNEKLVLHTDEVQSALQKSNFVLMRADWTQYDPGITNALSAIGRSGVPTYVIYPGSTSAKPDVLPEVLTKSVVLAAIQKDAAK
ncbi:protein-disulfide reductase DsbD family protein [Terriglobus aquaticus]|uniref:Protein-disulfide reductase DsbD family protein n=1 Tax=Terriglobus aquaticus TaxID=940139 RepID=A0ABW9KK85_9BACT|nr:thioredoxin family protein [Terriglobus aquaticus]